MVSGEDAAGVGIHHEAVVRTSIKQHAIRRLRSDPGNGEKAGAGFCPGTLEEAGEVGVVTLDQDAEERAESLRLDVEIAGRPDQAGEVGFGNCEEAPRSQATGSFEIGNGSFDVGPAGVLRENGADADFKGSFTGPPLLMSKVRVEEVVGLPE